MDTGELDEVYALMDAGDAAFNAKDAAGWAAATHPDGHSFQGDRWASPADFDAGLAEEFLAASEGWTTLWRDGLVVGDTACVWGECEWRFRLGDEAHVIRLASSWTWARTDGTWRSLFSHYTPLVSPAPTPERGAS